MNPFASLWTLLRSACLPGSLPVVCAAILASGLAAAPNAEAATIVNTATVTYTGPGGPVTKNSNTDRLTLPTPSVVTFYQYAPTAPGASSIAFDGGSYDSTGSGSYSSLATPVALDGTPISLASPVSVKPTTVYHLQEPIFITLADGNRNEDASVREFITVTVTTNTGDSEILLMQETGPDTGVFAAVIPSVAPGTPMASHNGQLSVGIDTRITVHYQDPTFLTDISTSAALVDPFGYVFDSVTGAKLDGATVTIVDAVTGLPATVYGDDGVSTYPSTVVTGAGVSDSGGTSYTLPTGSFRFPYVAPGSYRFVVVPPGSYTVPSSVPTASLANDPATGNPYSVVNGSRGEVFVVLPGPALNIDVPADLSTGGLLLQKQVSRTQASAGDFLQYRLTLQNNSGATATAPVLTDRLPFGMRYQAGSLRVDGQKVADPVVSSDGRSLTISLTNLAPAASAQISYVVALGAGVQPGDATNTARVIASSGVLTSNTAQVTVHIQEPLMTGRATVIGRVYEGDCNTPWDQLKGVPNVRLLMEDGTYVVTDKDGQYHFAGVRPGTHVVQLDLDSLPGGLEPAKCMANTRFAGRDFSQFVDVRGGGLWRADFFTKARQGEVGIRLQSRIETRQAEIAAPQAPMTVEVEHKVKEYTLRAEFDSCQASLKPEGQASVDKLVEELSGLDIKRIELTGNTDDQRLSVRCQQRFRDNYKLSEARAQTVGDALAGGLYLRPEQIVATGRGPDAPVASNKTAEGRARNRRTEVKVFLNESAGQGAGLSQEAATPTVTHVTEVTGMSHRIEVDGSSGTGNLKVVTMLPDGTAYRRGSTRVDGQAAADPAEADGMLTFRLDGGGAGWRQVIEFATYPLPAAAPVATNTGPRHYTLRARFDSCSSSLRDEGQAAVTALVGELRGKGRIKHIDVAGYTDSQALSARCQQRYADNKALSQAQAQAVAEALAKGLGLAADQIEAHGQGAAQPVADNASAAGRARNRRAEITVQMAEDLGEITRGAQAPVSCPTSAYAFKSLASFDTAEQKHGQTPAAETRVGCAAGETPAAAAPAEADSSRRTVTLAEHARVKELPAELQARLNTRQAITDNIAASGAKTDWLTGQAPGIAWLFPAPDHNPRAPAVRIVIKHLPGQTVTLRQADGSEVSALNFDGTEVSADRSVAISVWRGVPLKDGANDFRAEVRAADGSLVQELHQSVHYANSPARAELVPEQSVLVADGIHRPVLAVRLLDRDGHPVRAGVTGPLHLNAPYRSWQEVEQEQNRQLAGIDRFDPQYTVEGDDGIAYVELAPTTESGTVQLDLSFQLGDRNFRSQELRAWLEPQARDWVIVGFAEGTVGYNTLKDKSQALAGQVEDHGYSDGQVSLYAKGRVLGKWLLTMAYDSNRPERRQSLLGVIDPDQYYTLYGDGAEQRYDAPSQSHLYLKLERGQFYALFGDYNTGLTQTKLARYSRTLNGLKSEKADGPVVFTMFAAETPQRFARDELQGDGTSGLYHLSQRDIVLNSEKIRLETRDRLHSEKILETRYLSRHIDYDIDYGNGTLFFKQPVTSRDPDFNPVFIVAEYETQGVAENQLNAGGRVGFSLGGGRAQLGVSAIHDESNTSSTNLGGADLKLKLGKDSELRVEAAQSKGEVATLSPEGMAWLTEIEHHSGRYDALVYARRQEPGFGVGQQNLSETGQQKFGVEGQVRLVKNWSVLGQLYEQENLGTQATRDAAQAKLQYKTDVGGFQVGAQVIDDQANTGVLAGRDFRSEQLTAGANRYLLNRKLELTAQAETGFGGQNESVDFPDRYLAGASYALNDHVRLIAGQEFTDGAAFDTSTTRVGLQTTPWKGARLDSTLNQSEISEYGPRTFSVFGLSQGLVLNERWGMDVSLDSSQTLHRSGQPVLVVNPNHPVAPGGTQTAAALTEDYVAISTGATYRTPLWSWNGRIEDRNGETTDRVGFISNFLRQARAGVAFASSTRYFHTEQSSGTEGELGSVDLSWAWRPLGVQWSILDRLEVRYEDVANGSGIAGSGLFGNNSLTAVNASTRRLINNFALNRVSREWTEADRSGNLFRRYERNQWSLYYGAKYVIDEFDGTDYHGYTDLIGLELRHDLKSWLDLGLQASSLNGWTTHTHAYSFGPMIGASPVENGWITLGWNLRGFTDGDFDAARYTAQGPYLQLRLKFDQNTRLPGHQDMADTSERTR